MSQDKDNNEAASAPDLHSAIMNLPCNPPDGWGGIQQTGYKLGHRDARHAAAELVSASASQSSTAGAAKGGITSIDTPEFNALAARYGNTKAGKDYMELCAHVDNFLAHVARQESAADTVEITPEKASLEWMAERQLRGIAASEGSRQIYEEAYRAGREARSNAAAVAEGVDTDALKLQMVRFRNASNGTVHEERDRLLAMFATYGAQQREAGRRDRDQDFGLLKLALEQTQERLRQADAAIAERDATALRVAQCAGEFAKEAARQPVSEGLTEKRAALIHRLRNPEGVVSRGVMHDAMKEAADLIEQFSAVSPARQLVSEPMGYAIFRDGKQIGIEQSKEETGYWANSMAVPLGPLSAVPPAKAEGMSALQEAYGYLWHVNAAHEAPPGEVLFSLTPEQAAYKARKVLRDLLTHAQRGKGINEVRAILAQQAKGETK